MDKSDMLKVNVVRLGKHDEHEWLGKYKSYKKSRKEILRNAIKDCFGWDTEVSVKGGSVKVSDETYAGEYKVDGERFKVKIDKDYE